jgi:hemerythrin-like metal-binding protein
MGKNTEKRYNLYMPIIQWDPIYSVNVTVLDNQHKMLINFINSIHDKLAGGSYHPEDFETFFPDLESHAQLHFSTEEKFFDEFHYEKTEEHKKQHRSLVERILELQKKFDETKSSDVLFQTLDLLDDWILIHIMEQDKQYVKCFTSNGLH